MPWRTWTFWFLVAATPYVPLQTVLVYSFFSNTLKFSAETWVVLLKLFYAVCLFAPNQVGLGIFSLLVTRPFNDLSRTQMELLHAALFLIAALPIAFYLGRKLTDIQKRRGLRMALAIYFAISIAANAIWIPI